jgi:hypothetical protein
MKSQNKIRMTMMLMGIGAAMLFASTARAQQDMDPTYFDVNPGTPAVKATTIRTAQLVHTAAQKSRDTESALSIASGKDATLEAGLTRVAVIDGALALIFFGGFASIVAYAVAATKREYLPRDLSYNPANRFSTVSATPVQ